MRRLLLSTVACAALAAATLPAHATPYAGQFRYLGTGNVTVHGADGARWNLRVLATKGDQVQSRPEQRLYVDLSRCAAHRCVTVGAWSRPLTDNEISIAGGRYSLDPSGQPHGVLHTVLGGRTLDVQLTSRGGGGGGFAGAGYSLSPPGVAPEYDDYEPASGTLRLGLLSCGVQSGGYVGQDTLVDTVGADSHGPRTVTPANLPAGFLSGKLSPTC